MSRAPSQSPKGVTGIGIAGRTLAYWEISRSFELVCCHSSFEDPSLDDLTACFTECRVLGISSSHRITVRVRGSDPPTGVGKTRKAHEKHIRPPIASTWAHCWTIRMGIAAWLRRKKMPFRPALASNGSGSVVRFFFRTRVEPIRLKCHPYRQSGWDSQLYSKCIDAGIQF
jgi:hypothetical protein